jgi:hypothetical protein
LAANLLKDGWQQWIKTVFQSRLTKTPPYASDSIVEVRRFIATGQSSKLLKSKEASTRLRRHLCPMIGTAAIWACIVRRYGEKPPFLVGFKMIGETVPQSLYEAEHPGVSWSIQPG